MINTFECKYIYPFPKRNFALVFSRLFGKYMTRIMDHPPTTFVLAETTAFHPGRHYGVFPHNHFEFGSGCVAHWAGLAQSVMGTKYI